MAEEQNFSLGELDETPDYINQEEENEQEELHPEDVTEGYQESDSEEFEEDEEHDEEDLDEDYEEEVEDDGISYTPFVEPLLEDGILWIDEDKEYDDSPEGFQEILQDTINYRLQEVLEGLPEEALQLIEVAQNGGDIREAFETFNSFDYSQIDLEDTDNQRNLVKDYYEEKFPNWSADRLEKAIQTAEDLDDLAELAQEAQGYFIEQSEGEREAYMEQVRAAQEEREAQQYQEIMEYHKLIDESTGFEGLEFTSNRDKEEFKRYCFEKGKDGLTQYERDTQHAENRMTQAFYTYKGFGAGYIEKKARTNAYIEQKRILSRVKDKNASNNKLGSREIDRPSKGFNLGLV
jgi:hypothetical protein